MSVFSKNKKKKSENRVLKPFALNKGEKSGKGNTAGRIALVTVIALAVCIVYGVARMVGLLADIYHEQCRVDNCEVCVSVSSGKMIAPELIASRFGLTNGVNLAEVPFADIRSELLKNVPQIKELRITRHLPNRVKIEVTEREPAVRLSGAGRVADAEGVVFEYYRNTQMLPLITDNEAASDAVPGNRLSGHAAAALRLIIAAATKNGDVAPVKILKADATRPDFLLLTLGDYDQAKFAWPNMDDDTQTANDAMNEQLRCLAVAIATQLGKNGKLWNVTVPGRAFIQIPEFE